MIAVPTESPTRIASTPDSSTRRPNSASYAVITTIFSPFRLRSAKSRTVTGRSLVLSNPGAPEFNELAQPERSIRKLAVRDAQIRIADALFFVEHDVEVERARAPTAVSHAPRTLLDSHQLTE